MNEPVSRFLCTDSSYVAYLENGLRLDFARVRNYTHDTSDPEDYFTYMWVESVQGYYIMRQHVLAGIPSDWTVLCEVLPGEDSGSSFFEAALDLLPQWLEEWGLR